MKLVRDEDAEGGRSVGRSESVAKRHSNAEMDSSSNRAERPAMHFKDNDNNID